MTKNSTRFEKASMSIVDLLREVNQFPIHILDVIGSHMSDVLPDDYAQEKVPTFIQQMDALYAEKSSRLADAREQDDMDTAYRLYNERQLLHAMLTYFACAVAPAEWLERPFSWHIRKDFVLVYRKISTEKNDSDEDSDDGVGDEAPAPQKPKRILN